MSEADEIEPYENTMSLDELRREVRRLWDREHALTKALRELPEVPPWRVLYVLSSAAKWPDDHEVGKRMQREFGLDAIAPRSEPEGGAGLWHHIRTGVLAARTAALTEKDKIAAAIRTPSPATSE
jgi:hypothetical protein